MFKRTNIRAAAMGLILSTMLSIPTLAVAQMAPSGSMGDNKMMPMGEGQMEGKMEMPDKMPPKKPGCCGMGGMAAKAAPMPAKTAKPHHHHRAKAKPAAAKKAPAAAAKPAAVKNAPAAAAKPAPMPMKM